MYRIHREKNRIERLENRTFFELGFKERDNLQEWVSNYPQVFGEELLIIQKEFAGFSDTNERLDLLALDKRACRIKSEIQSNVFEKKNWPEMIKFMCDSMVQLEDTFKKPIKKIGTSLK